MAEKIQQSVSEFQRKYKKSANPIYVEQFGAIGDGINDDTDAIQRAIDYAPEHSHIILSGNYKISSILLNKKYLSLRGGGTLKDGKIVIGTSTEQRQDLFIDIRDLTFEYSDRLTGNYGIELLKARRILIENNVFIGCDKSIYVNPLSTAIAHDTAQIKVFKNEFVGVNYAFYVDRHESVTWMHTSDCKFIGNNINVAYIAHVYCKSIDGFILKDNICFFPSFNTTDQSVKQNKKYNVYIGQSDFVIIQGNNLFEAGEEGIWLDMPKHFIISNNNIAWNGQKIMSDAIRLTGANLANGCVSDNIISKFTKHAIGVYTQGGGAVTVSNNHNEYDSGNAFYYGTPALNTVTHYGVHDDITCTDSVIQNANTNAGGIQNSYKGSLFTTYRSNSRSGYSGSIKENKSVTSPNTPLFAMKSYKDSLSTYDGIVIITAKSTTAENGNSSSYVFHVSKHALGVTLTKLSEQGLLSGGSANHTSFTFSIDPTTGELLVSPIGSTSGVFHFYATYFGNIKLL